MKGGQFFGLVYFVLWLSVVAAGITYNVRNPTREEPPKLFELEARFEERLYPGDKLHSRNGRYHIRLKTEPCTLALYEDGTQIRKRVLTDNECLCLVAGERLRARGLGFLGSYIDVWRSATHHSAAALRVSNEGRVALVNDKGEPVEVLLEPRHATKADSTIPKLYQLNDVDDNWLLPGQKLYSADDRYYAVFHPGTPSYISIYDGATDKEVGRKVLAAERIDQLIFQRDGNFVGYSHAGGRHPVWASNTKSLKLLKLVVSPEGELHIRSLGGTIITTIAKPYAVPEKSSSVKI